MFISVVTVILAAAAFLSSVVVPAITSWQNNKHDKEMFLLKFYSDHQAEAFSEYLKQASRIIQFGSRIADDYLNTFGTMLLYLPSDLHDEAQGLHFMLLSDTPEDATYAYESFAKKLHELIPADAQLDAKKADVHKN